MNTILPSEKLLSPLSPGCWLCLASFSKLCGVQEEFIYEAAPSEKWLAVSYQSPMDLLVQVTV